MLAACIGCASVAFGMWQLARRTQIIVLFVIR